MKVPLHFVGKATYNIDLFTREARKYGVSRAFPPNIVKKLPTGSVILLAVKDRDDMAKVFGFFVYSGLIVSDPEVTEEVVRGLKVRYVEGCEVVRRGCGSYVITGSYVVEHEDWSKVVERIYESSKRRKFKVFVTGKFYKLKEFTVKAKFTRGITYVDVDEQLLKDVGFTAEQLKLIKIKDYVYIPYRKEREKAALICSLEGNTLERWLK